MHDHALDRCDAVPVQVLVCTGMRVGSYYYCTWHGMRMRRIRSAALDACGAALLRGCPSRATLASSHIVVGT